MNNLELAQAIIARMEEIKTKEGTVDSPGNDTFILARVLQEKGVTVLPKPKRIQQTDINGVFHYDTKIGG